MIGGKSNARTRPTALGLSLSASTYGATIPTVYGMTRCPLLLIWNGNIRQGSSSKKSKKKGATTYIENADFLIASNPVVGINQAWNNNNEKYFLTPKVLNYVIPGSTPTNDLTFQIPPAPAAPDPDFYSVIGVTATVDTISGTFNDYGAPGPVSYGGSTELPLWNLSLQGPDLLRSGAIRYWPYVYNWNPTMGPYIYLPDVVTLFSLFDQINVYYFDIDRSVNGGQSPLGKMRLTFEDVLGNGPEYTGSFASQQILYPEYCGAGSEDLDLGVAALIPNIRLEVQGSYGVYPTGDTDYTNMIEDIIKSGALQVGTDLGQIQRGLNCNDLPGVVQQNFMGYNALSLPHVPFYQPNQAGSVLVVAAHYQSGGGGAPTIADTAGNTYIPVFTADQFGVWYCASAVGGANTVTVTPNGGGSRNASGIFIMELDPDSTVPTIGTVVSGTGGASATANITITGNLPTLLLGILIADTAVSTGPPPTHWTALFPQSQSMAYRIVSNPGVYSLTYPLSVASTWKMAILAFQAPQAVSYAKTFGKILDDTSLAVVLNQCRANGLWGSINMDSQKKAGGWLKDIYDCADAAPVWSGFKLKSIARSEVSFYGNGTVYNAPTASGPVANLSDTNGDFIGDANTPIISVVRKPRVDADNLMQFQHPNRASDYNDVITAQPETGSLSLYGPRKASPRDMRMIQDVGVARMVLGILVRRQNYLMNTYKFKLKAKWKLLEPMDLATITDSIAGINQVPVRITSVQEDAEFNLDCEAEPFIYGLHAPLPLATQDPTPNAPATSTVPGLINPPIIFEAVPRLSQQQNQSDLVLVVSNEDPNYGGCTVLISTDGGESYNPLGSDPMILGNASTGRLLADWPAALDPDTTNDLPLDLSESNGALASYQVQDEDSFTYPCYIDEAAQPTFVQAQHNGVSGTSVAKAFDANVTVGNYILVIVAVSFGNTSTIGVSDNLGNTYTSIKTYAPSQTKIQVFLAPVTTGGACTVTVTQTTSQPLEIVIREYSGIASLDVSATAQAANTVTAGPLTPGQPNELLVAIAQTQSAGTGNVFTNTNPGFLNLTQDILPSQSLAVWDSESQGLAPISDTVESSIASAVSMVFLAFKGPSSGAITPIPYELMTYAVATLVAANQYTLKATGGGTNHLRRAVFAAPSTAGGVDHPAGCRFAFLGAPEQATPLGILKVPIDPKWIGVTLYFKFVAFNQFISGMQALGDVVAYSYTPTGIPGSTQNPNSNYVQTPAIALLQPTATSVAMAQVSTQFPSNAANYNARTFTIPDPGGTPTTYYVTIADAGNVGDQGTTTNLTATCQASDALVGVPGNTYIGFIIATHAAGATATPAPGGWPPPASAVVTP